MFIDWKLFVSPIQFIFPFLVYSFVQHFIQFPCAPAKVPIGSWLPMLIKINVLHASFILLSLSLPLTVNAGNKLINLNRRRRAHFRSFSFSTIVLSKSYIIKTSILLRIFFCEHFFRIASNAVCNMWMRFELRWIAYQCNSFVAWQQFFFRVYFFIRLLPHCTWFRLQQKPQQHIMHSFAVGYIVLESHPHSIYVYR